MVKEIIYFTELLICSGAIAGSILLSDRLRRSYSLPFLTSYFFYIVLISFFAFTGIWGLVFFRKIIDNFEIQIDLLIKIGQLIPFLGFPFLIIGWYMLIRFCYQVFNREVTQWLNAGYFIFLITFFLLFTYFFNDIEVKSNWLEGLGGNLVLFIFLILDVSFHLFAASILLRNLKLINNSRAESIWKNYSFIQIIIQLVKIILAFIVINLGLLIHIYIVFFFLSLTLPVLFIYRNINPLVTGGFYSQVLKIDQQALFVKNGITKREKEIIECIYSGLTNQETADKLFITLQTVKDHTHRIYLKMDVKNRMQLTTLLNSVAE